MGEELVEFLYIFDTNIKVRSSDIFRKNKQIKKYRFWLRKY